MPSITIRVSDEDMAAIDARSVALTRELRVRISRAACVRRAVDAYVTPPSSSGQLPGGRPLPPRTRTRASV